MHLICCSLIFGSFSLISCQRTYRTIMTSCVFLSFSLSLSLSRPLRKFSRASFDILFYGPFIRNSVCSRHPHPPSALSWCGREHFLTRQHRVLLRLSCRAAGLKTDPLVKIGDNWHELTRKCSDMIKE